jgi:putative ABC transport system permease protein
VALCLVSAGSAFGGILSVGLGTDRWEAATADVGLNRIGLLAVSIAGPAASADSRVTELAARTLQGHDAVEQVSPGRAPIQRGGLLGSLAIDSAIDTDGARTVTVLWAQQGYFDTLGIRVLRGLAHDVDQLELAIVLPERVARTLQVDVGDLVRLNGFTHEVVAIVSDTYGEGPLAAPDAVVYVRPGGPFSEWVVRVRPAGQTSVDNLRSALAPLLGPRQRLEIVDIDRLLRERLAPYTSLALLVWAVAGLTLGLACCALIVAARTSVEQSSREWAIRLALGARHRDVKWLLYWRLVLPVVLGALLGVVGLGLLVTFSGGTGLQWPSAGWIAVLVGMALTVTPALLTVLVTSAGFRHMAIAQHLQP